VGIALMGTVTRRLLKIVTFGRGSAELGKIERCLELSRSCCRLSKKRRSAGIAASSKMQVKLLYCAFIDSGQAVC
jgi:hypothetical protein